MEISYLLGLMNKVWIRLYAAQLSPPPPLVHQFMSTMSQEDCGQNCSQQLTLLKLVFQYTYSNADPQMPPMCFKDKIPWIMVH